MPECLLTSCGQDDGCQVGVPWSGLWSFRAKQRPSGGLTQVQMDIQAWPQDREVPKFNPRLVTTRLFPNASTFGMLMLSAAWSERFCLHTTCLHPLLTSVGFPGQHLGASLSDKTPVFPYVKVMSEKNSLF